MTDLKESFLTVVGFVVLLGIFGAPLFFISTHVWYWIVNGWGWGATITGGLLMLTCFVVGVEVFKEWK